MEWKQTPPIPEDLNGESEEYFWAKGGNFNRMILVRANNGVFSEIVDGKRQYRPEVNFSFYTENCPDHIWAHDLGRWNLAGLEWYGPVPRPGKF
jgi:hypothetical protein